MVSLGSAIAAFLLVWASLVPAPTTDLRGIPGEDSAKYNNKHDKQLVVQSVVRYLLKKHEQEASNKFTHYLGNLVKVVKSKEYEDLKKPQDSGCFFKSSYSLFSTTFRLW